MVITDLRSAGMEFSVDHSSIGGTQRHQCQSSSPLCSTDRSTLWHSRSLWFRSLLLRHRGGREDLLLWLHDADVVREGLLGANLATGVPGQHNLHLNSQHTCGQMTPTWSDSCELHPFNGVMF